MNTSHYDCIVVLCGGLYRKKNGDYAPTEYRHADEFGMLGGNLRILATVAFFLQRKSKNVCFSTGKSAKQIEKFGKDVPTEAQIYAQFFQSYLQKAMRKSNVADLVSPKIFLEDRSVNTVNNLQNVIAIIKQQQWREIAVVSNDYHLPRISALYHMLMQKNKYKINISFLSAEEIVKDAFPNKYNVRIQKAYSSKIGKLRVKNELKGLADLKNAQYVLQEYQLHTNKK